MSFHVDNPHLSELIDDTLYHFGLSKSDFDFRVAFGDVRYVCIGGSSGRFRMYAELFSKKSGYSISPNMSKTDRFCLYKTGPVIWANHGMGVPSLSIMLNEMFKILHYAGISDVTFIRLGTSGGVGIDPGTVVVTNTAINSRLTESYDLDINGITTSFPCLLDQKLANDLYEAGILLNYKVEIGKTLCANDFYEGQMRLDGSFSQGNEDNKFEFLRRLQRLGVKNIEMECTGFAAMTHRVGAKAAIVCVALVNRMNGDQVRISKDIYVDFELRPFNIVSDYIISRIGRNPTASI